LAVAVAVVAAVRRSFLIMVPSTAGVVAVAAVGNPAIQIHLEEIRVITLTKVPEALNREAAEHYLAQVQEVLAELRPILLIMLAPAVMAELGAMLAQTVVLHQVSRDMLILPTVLAEQQAVQFQAIHTLLGLQQALV
jgi:hypothetical protein